MMPFRQLYQQDLILLMEVMISTVRMSIRPSTLVQIKKDNDYLNPVPADLVSSVFRKMSSNVLDQLLLTGNQFVFFTSLVLVLTAGVSSKE
jgi:hypothetical protein